MQEFDTSDKQRFVQFTLVLVGSLGLLVIALGILLVAVTTIITGDNDQVVNNLVDPVPEQKKVTSKREDKIWSAPELKNLDGHQHEELILYGKEIIEHTAKYYGPAGIIAAGSTNGMNCQNCHLEAGTKPFGNNYAAVASTYPKYRGRSGSEEDIPKRVNDCFERSLNGKPINSSSKEMKAIVAYIQWLGQEIPKGEKPYGAGLKDLPYMEFAASPELGKPLYKLHCASCHGIDGLGVFNSSTQEYTYPPVFGSKSFNIGAGLFRIGTLARFIKYNMPLGVQHDNPILTDEEAWHIAAYINSQEHPFKDLKADWPHLEEKPVDHPFGPYSDTFSEIQHKYGPFKPILATKEK